MEEGQTSQVGRRSVPVRLLVRPNTDRTEEGPLVIEGTDVP